MNPKFRTISLVNNCPIGVVKWLRKEEDLQENLKSMLFEKLNKDLTIGYNHHDFKLKIYGPNGNVMDDIDQVWGVLTDENNDENHPLQTINFKERSGNIWVPDDPLLPWFPGQLIITVKNNTSGNEHDGNFTFDVDYATIIYTPNGVTAGLDIKDFKVTLTALDTNGEPLPEGLNLYLWIENETRGCELADSQIKVKKDGYAEFEINRAGDLKTWINITLQNNNWETGNATSGNFTIDWPHFECNPDVIFIGRANTVTITVTDYAGEPIEGLNLTLWNGGTSFSVPEPVETDVDGKAEFSIEPMASGKANVTIVRNINYVNGQLLWDIEDAIITDTHITITSIREMRISVSKSSVFQGDTFTVTITSQTNPLSDVDVEFTGITIRTNANGQSVFTAPDPGIESVIYMISAEKTGYLPIEKSITVIKKWDIKIILPTELPVVGEEFTLTIIAKGEPLAGATVDFNEKTFYSGVDGKLKITAPDKKGNQTITASFEDYNPATATIKVREGNIIPGFELVIFVIALGVIFLVLLRHRNR